MFSQSAGQKDANSDVQSAPGFRPGSVSSLRIVVSCVFVSVVSAFALSSGICGGSEMYRKTGPQPLTSIWHEQLSHNCACFLSEWPVANQCWKIIRLGCANCVLFPLRGHRTSGHRLEYHFLAGDYIAVWRLKNRPSFFFFLRITFLDRWVRKGSAGGKGHIGTRAVCRGLSLVTRDLLSGTFAAFMSSGYTLLLQFVVVQHLHTHTLWWQAAFRPVHESTPLIFAAVKVGVLRQICAR